MNRAGAPPARSDRTIRVWIAITLATSVLICTGVVALHVLHKQALERSTAIIRDLRQARVDLAQGFLHVSLGGAPRSPWQREQGLALLAQALADFERSLGALPARSENADEFAAQLRAFRAQLRFASGLSGIFGKCSPSERALARGGEGGGFGFARTARQAVQLSFSAGSWRAENHGGTLPAHILSRDHAWRPAFKASSQRSALAKYSVYRSLTCVGSDFAALSQKESLRMAHRSCSQRPDSARNNRFESRCTTLE